MSANAQNEAEGKASSSRSRVRFSYSTPDQPRLQRAVIRAIELVGGQRRLKRLYESQAYERGPDETFFDVSIRKLKLDVVYSPDRLAAVPAEGPVVFVANHPYGVLDGLVLSALTLKVRPDTQIMANEILSRVPETREHLLPVDFAETREALATNIASRRAALGWLRQGGAVGIFPGGGVATSERPLGRSVFDLPWHPFTAKLIRATRATVVPVLFSGHNSRLFQVASHVSLTLRLSLMFHETARRIGSRLDVAIGEPIPYDALAGIEDREELVAELRRRTYALGAATRIDWSRHGRIRGDRRQRGGANATRDERRMRISY